MENLSFTQVYNNYSAAIYSVICQYIKDRSTAQDVLQISFVKIAKHLKNYDATKGVLFTWMRTIAVNTALDELRSHNYKTTKNQMSIDDAAFNAMQFTVQCPLPEVMCLERVLNVLNENERVVIDLLYFKQYSHVETSACLAIPLGTVKSRVRLALGKLRKYYAADLHYFKNNYC